MQLDVGTIRSNKEGFDSIARLGKESRNLWLDSVVLDFANCKFFDANMSAPLYAIIAKQRDDLNDVSAINFSPKVREILQKNKFLPIVFNVSSLPDINSTTIPFKIFKLTAGEQFVEYLNSYMNGKGIPRMSEVLTRHFRNSLLEIFQNSAMHSQSEFGVFTCGQFFPQEHHLDFTIVDAGIGIRDNVRKYTGIDKINSIKAIQWALREGNTTKTNTPGGLGLKLLKDFIYKNNGKLQIISRFGYYEFSSFEDKFQKLSNDFKGTCVNISINTGDTSSYCLRSESNNK